MAVALRDTVDFAVECPEGELGRVEEVWLGPTGEPRALAVRLRDGRHALLLDDDVVSVDREHRWVVVGPEPELRELAPPRLDGVGDGRLVASWSTTGAVVRASPPSWLPDLARHVPHLNAAERPLWQQVAILYAGLSLIVMAVVGLVYGIAWAVGGAPY